MSALVILELIIVVVLCGFLGEIYGGEEIEGSANKILQESRKKQQDTLFSIIPMLAMPFLMQTTMLPFVLFFMKLTLVKSIFLGKLGVFLWIVNMLRNRLQESQGGFSSHNVNAEHNYHEAHFRERNADWLLHREHSSKEISGSGLDSGRRRRNKSKFK